ncbi:hypothetical protein [Cellulomonas cellasea]|uniref:Uncharacterized protein n=1 Tax=Cellulomonas cellasea TaxID=43670 RepID=A0A4Y3KSY0_9CELL|nr:hypothetical protein [Cellulomonas cellasea]GEA87541.1 hypothetical protein CCE01nite_14900 [Cellulomonas cellasea]
MAGHKGARRAVGAVLAGATALLGAAAAPAGATGGAGQGLCADGVTAVAGVTVEGDAWVDGAVCDLTDVVVTGDLTVYGDRQVTLTGVTVGGDLGAKGLVTLTGSTVQGGILASAASLVVQDSHVWHSVRGYADTATVSGSVVDGAVNVRAKDLTVELSTVGGWANLIASQQAEVAWSTFGRGLTSKGAGELWLCGSDVAADVAVRGLANPGRVGATTAAAGNACSTASLPADHARAGLADAERDAVNVGGWLVVEHNLGAVTLASATVAGNLSCASNWGAVDFVGATVAGLSTGQCWA